MICTTFQPKGKPHGRYAHVKKHTRKGKEVKEHWRKCKRENAAEKKHRSKLAVKKKKRLGGRMPKGLRDRMKKSTGRGRKLRKAQDNVKRSESPVF